MTTRRFDFFGADRPTSVVMGMLSRPKDADAGGVGNVSTSEMVQRDRFDMSMAASA